jgi:hypothetical protein
MMVEISLWLGPILLALLIFAITLVIFRFGAKTIERRMHMPAGVWLGGAIAGASIASLFQGRLRPAVNTLFIGLGLPERVHRGWPMPWVGMPGIERFYAPVMLAVDTFVWTALSCILMYVVSLPAAKLTSSVLRGLALSLTAIGMTALAYFIPFLIAAIE